MLADKSAFSRNKETGIDSENKTKQKKKKNEELRSINKKFKKQKVSLLFIDKIWGADLVDIQLLSKLIRETLFYCVIDFFFLCSLCYFKR